MKNIEDVLYRIPSYEKQSPIVIIGAGAIIESAHLPAYQLAGFQVQAITDRQNEKAQRLAKRFSIPDVCNSQQEMVERYGITPIYDVAVPGDALLTVLSDLPDGCFVLMQKPMGENEQQAIEILDLCRQKKMAAAVNFQLRYAPYMLMAKELINEGWLGDVCDVEIYVNVHTPWHLWNFLDGAKRVEILYHSIHYIDLVRHLLGQPAGIFAQTNRHPDLQQLQEVRSTIIMDYGEFLRVNILTNHVHTFGLKHQDAYIKIEGTRGAVKIGLGSLVNYPHGITDTFDCITTEGNQQGQWRQLPVNGSWFPHAFIGSMGELMKTRSGAIAVPDNSVEDCIATMQLVERAYHSSARKTTDRL